MYTYAQLNDSNTVVGISQLTGEEVQENLIRIDGLKVELGSTYDKDTNTFTPPQPEPVEPQPSLEELQNQTLLETQYQTVLLELLSGF